MIQQLTPAIILGIIALYFLVLIAVSYFTGKDARNENFFLAGRQSHWAVVAFGMIGASLSGVTFISIPGVVGADGLNQSFSYMQVVLGYLLGYLFIATVLMPMYYRLQLTSIYGYLEQRFGFFAYKTGAAYFLLSRTIGAAFRLYLVAIVLQKFVMDAYGVPFEITVITTILLIWIYTFRGGINTIIWTDTLQTLCMLVAVVLTIYGIGSALDMSIGNLVDMVQQSQYSQVFFFEGGWSDPNNFFKQFFSGALITIVMTGLDQDMMQKNLSCPNIRDAQKNMFTFSIILVLANLLFLTLGALLYLYATQVGIEIPERTDQLFPTIALQHLSPAVGIIFVLGLIAAAYSSADSALTALTTSFCVDFLDFEKKEQGPELRRTRFIVHISFSFLLFFVIIAFNAINDAAVITKLFKVAGYTYGPILGLFAFGMLTKLKIRDHLVIPVCLAAPVIAYVLDLYSKEIFFGFEFGFLTIALNGLLTFLGLLAISYREYEAAMMENESLPS
ncbi:MAG: sodium:solute symporter [Saprospiraceae bacterium]|nr:sodium:solute symporter [Saprospiraceae bacterium]